MGYKKVVSQYRKCTRGVTAKFIGTVIKVVVLASVLFAIYEIYRLFVEDFKFVRLITAIIAILLAHYCRKAISFSNRYYDKKINKWKKQYFEPYLDSLPAEFVHDFEINDARFSYSGTREQIPVDEVPIIYDLHYDQRPKLTYVHLEKGFSENYPNGHYKHALHLPTKFGEVKE